MKRRDLAELLLLAALWGGSFLFMRVAAPAFGPLALVFLRVAGAALLLVPLLAARGLGPELARHWRDIAVVGLTNSALPFLCFAYAALHITAGVSAIFNSASPLFAALIAWAWLGDRMTAWRVLGLVVGFAGVVFVGLDRSGAGADAGALAIVASVLATIFYGFSPSFAQRRLAGVAPLAVAGGSQLFATLFLAVPAIAFWPQAAPSTTAWTSAALLALLCTGVAYILYFRLIASAGPANAISVTYLVPIFAIAWGWLVLDEPVTPALVAGCVVVFVGTAMATGVLAPRLAALRSPARSPRRPARRGRR